MTKRFSRLLPLWVVVAAACSSSSNEPPVLYHPSAIEASALDLKVDGRTTRLVYVANRLGGTVSVVDQVQEKLLDTDAGDDFANTPIFVGGELAAMALRDGPTAPRIFVADAAHREVFAVDAVPNTDPTAKAIRHVPVDLGPDAVVQASEPVFKDTGRSSTPVMQNLTVDPSTVIPQAWEVKYIDDTTGYSVIGSVSGQQTARAKEGTSYTTDDGSVGFLITPGGDPTNGDDRFFFGTTKAKPLELTGVPVDLKIDGARLLIVTKTPAQLIVLDLDTLTAGAPIDLIDGTATEPIPGKCAVGNGHLYVPNSASPNAIDVDLGTFSLTTLDTGVASPAASLDGVTDSLYLVSPGTRELNSFNLGTGTPEPAISLSDFADASLYPYTLGGTTYGLVPLASGAIDVIDVAGRKRVDTNISSGSTQSAAIGEEFFDAGALSAPELVSVKTYDGVTRTERWQVIYESTGTYRVIGSISGVQAGQVTEGTSYTSDGGEMSLTIRPSRSRPTTEGDFFSFLTVDGIDPIRTSQKRGAVGISVFTRPGDTKLTAYVAQEGSGSISSIELNNFSERTTIN